MAVVKSPTPRIIQFTLTMQKIGSIDPLSTVAVHGGSVGFGAGIAFGDSFFYSQTNLVGANYTGFVGIRVKKDGSYCVIRSNDTSGKLIDSLTGLNSRQIGPSQFLVSNTNGGNGSFQQFNLPFSFSNKAVYYIPQTAINPPSPCGSGVLSASFYCAQQKLIAYEFKNAFPDAYFDYASIYQQNNFGQQLINGGYIGHFANAVQGFNQTALSLPAYVDNNYQVTDYGGLGFQQGWSWYYNEAETGNWSMGAARIRLVQGGDALNCGASGNNQTFVVSDSAFNYDYTQFAGTKKWAGYSGYMGSGYSETAEIFVAPGCYFNNQQALVLFSSEFLAQIIITPAIVLSACVLYKDGTLIGLRRVDAMSAAIEIWSAKIDFATYGISLRPVVQSIGNGLINYHRPVSPKGSFIA